MDLSVISHIGGFAVFQSYFLVRMVRASGRTEETAWLNYRSGLLREESVRVSWSLLDESLQRFEEPVARELVSRGYARHPTEAELQDYLAAISPAPAQQAPVPQAPAPAPVTPVAPLTSAAQAPQPPLSAPQAPAASPAPPWSPPTS